MADFFLWSQGNATSYGPNCDGIPPKACPSSQRVSVEHKHGYYLQTAAIAPYQDRNNCGNPGWAPRLLADVAEGDVVWLMVLPPHSSPILIPGASNGSGALGPAVVAGKSLIQGSDLGTLAGLQMTLVSGIFRDQAVQEVAGNVTTTQYDICLQSGNLITSELLTMDNGDFNKGTNSFIWRNGVGAAGGIGNLGMDSAHVPRANQWIAYGLRIDAMPDNPQAQHISEITGYISVMVPTIHYDHQLVF